MAHDGGGQDERANSLLYELRLSLLQLEPHTSGEQGRYDRGLTQVHEMADARRLRLLEVQQGIPLLLWIVLIGGGVITVCFTYLFGLKSNWAHALIVAALTLVICAILFTIGAFDYPFSGVVRIYPTAFEEVLRSFQEFPGPGS